ncbi:hypothetical protein JCM10908_001743 [Rhodotorula pacifica]|uniref:uncharacterized protein n=1 Tax=Rhodotorula pacifica TaxID=1495444 RepID=UPI0031717964
MTTATPSIRERTALVLYPQSQFYVLNSLKTAFAAKLPHWCIASSRNDLVEGTKPDLQWSDYDELDWDWVMDENTLANSYAIRKALIRKSNLAHTIALYLSKNPDSPLRRAAPKTFHFTCSFADEIDELLMDDLYEVDQSFTEAENGAEPKWWILKAALADKGNGIRLFSDRDTLEEIFREFEPESDDEEEEVDDDEGEADGQGEVAEGGAAAPTRAAMFGADTRVDATQLREWVIQEYVSNPLLLDPAPPSNANPTKFHLRVYVVAVGGITVYVHHPFLALFASSSYTSPAETASETGEFDLSAHLTNTCLQTAVLGEEAPQVSVSTLQSMVDKTILSGTNKGEKLGAERIQQIEERVRETVAEVFKAAVGAGSSFQPLPNAFEIFGVDLLVDDNFGVSLLEINACPDFGQTGADLQEVIDHLFACTIDVAVRPFFARADARDADSPSDVSQISDSFEQLEVRGSRGLKEVLRLQVRKAF